MSFHEEASAETEHRYHDYRSHQIPWYVRVIWLLFWIFTVAYLIKYLFPALQEELFLRP